MDFNELIKLFSQSGAPEDRTALISALANGNAASLLPLLMNGAKRGYGTSVQTDPSEIRLPCDDEVRAALAKLSELPDD